MKKTAILPRRTEIKTLLRAHFHVPLAIEYQPEVGSYNQKYYEPPHRKTIILTYKLKRRNNVVSQRMSGFQIAKAIGINLLYDDDVLGSIWA